MRKTDDGKSKRSKYVIFTEALNKSEGSRVAKPHLTGYPCSSIPSQLPSSHSFRDKDDNPFKILSRNNNKHLKRIDKTIAGDTVSESLGENSECSIKNKCITSGNSGKRKPKKVPNGNSVTSRSSFSSIKSSTPFIRRLEEFIITDNELETSTPLRRVKALSEKHIEKIGKPNEVNKTRRPTRLKRSILNERDFRKAQRSQSLPAPVKIPFGTTESTDMTKITEFCTPVRFNDNSLKESTPSEVENHLVSELISRLATFQDRAYVIYANSPFHRKRTRRLVCGFHEVIKHLKLKHMRIIFVARDLEGNATSLWQDKIRYDEKEAGTKVVFSALEEILCQIWKLAEEYDPPVPIIITHTRRKLAHLCHKPRAVSVVGIINADGAYEIERKLLDMKSGVNLRYTESLANVEANAANKLIAGNPNTNIIETLLNPIGSIKIE
ncbi:unnamed protein product [Schistosoma turkestanicum]|nr:unnamed protein product [Schistosoma turkestanicum]